MKAAIDLNLNPEPDKSAGLLKASSIKGIGYGGVKGVEVYFDRDGQQVKNIRIKAGAGYGIIPHSQSEADDLMQQYSEALKNYLK